MLLVVGVSFYHVLRHQQMRVVTDEDAFQWRLPRMNLLSEWKISLKRTGSCESVFPPG